MQKNSIKSFCYLSTTIGLCSLLLLCSCSKDISLGNTGDLSRSPTEKAAAFQFSENVSFPIDLVVFIPCANGGVGEDVTFSGSLHGLFHITTNDNGVTVKGHTQPQGVKGIGATTGDIYNATGVTQDTQTGSFTNGSFTYTYVNNFRIIGPGTGNNYLIHENFKVTINANGTLVVEKDNFSIECK